MINRSNLLLVPAVLLGLPITAMATNGYFTYGVSTAEKGLAGAGVAYSQDTLAAGNNPAGMVWQGQGFDVQAPVDADLGDVHEIVPLQPLDAQLEPGHGHVQQPEVGGVDNID